MNGRILWIDNDPAQVRPFVQALREMGYVVNVVTTVGAGLKEIHSERHALVIMDVMIPTTESEELSWAPPVTTDQGYKTGLVLFRRVRDKLAEERTPVLVLTIRLDEEVREEFLEAGLSPQRFSTKYSLREVDRFLEKVSELIEGHRR